MPLGIVTAVLVAWTAAALRPTDGWPNALHTLRDGWTEWYLMPQHRQRSPWGDVYIDVTGSAVSTEVSLVLGWMVQTKGDWWDTTYPYPEDVPAWAREQHAPLSYKLPSWAATPDGSSTERNLVTSAWGWPALCLSGVAHQFPGYNSVNPLARGRIRLEGYWVFDKDNSGSPRVRRLPLRPIWSGLLLDTSVFGACWFGVLFAPGSVRRWRRRCRGRCPRCGYDLRHDLASGCPECGWGRDVPPAASA